MGAKLEIHLEKKLTVSPSGLFSVCFFALFSNTKDTSFNTRVNHKKQHLSQIRYRNKTQYEENEALEVLITFNDFKQKENISILQFVYF